MSNRAWVAGKIPRDLRRVTTVEWSIHRLIAELDDLDRIDEALEIAEQNGMTYRKVEKLVKRMKNGGAAEDIDDEDEAPAGPSKTTKTWTVSWTVPKANAPECERLAGKVEDIVREWLAEHGIDDAKITVSDR